MPTLIRHPDARAFLERAESWLAAREIENAVVLQSARQARANDTHYERPIYWATIENDGELIGCAYRTPPYKVGVTKLPDDAIAPLVKDLDATYPGAIGGFSGADAAMLDRSGLRIPVTWKGGKALSAALHKVKIQVDFEGRQGRLHAIYVESQP